MNELIKVNYDKERPTVLGRELHKFLDVETRYDTWFERMCEYGFTEGVDHCSFLSNGAGFGKAATRTDHQLTIDMAKEIAMIQRSEKGKQIRQYFIKIEEAWNAPNMVMSRALKMADKQIKSLSLVNAELQAENDKQKQIIGELQPAADYVNTILNSLGTMATTQIAADYGLSAKKLNNILKEERIQRNVGGQWILYNKHMGKGYTKSETIHIERADGRPDTKLFTRWTQRGRLMINEILNKRGIYASMDLAQIELDRYA